MKTKSLLLLAFLATSCSELTLHGEIDSCPDDPNKTEPGICGCGQSDEIDSKTGIPACLLEKLDLCPDDENKQFPGICGCGVPDEIDSETGIPTCMQEKVDLCPDDPNKTEPGICGCGQSDEIDSETGIPTCMLEKLDLCPDDPNKTEPGICECGQSDIDSDNDGIPDCIDICFNDPDKIEPGACGCGEPDTDSNDDTIPDCIDIPVPETCNMSSADENQNGVPDCLEIEGFDLCPDDDDKILPGVCGCGVEEDQTDSDDDGVPDCIDICFNDSKKRFPGVCGCDIPDNDSDGDSVMDCEDKCIYNPLLTNDENTNQAYRCHVTQNSEGKNIYHIYTADDLFNFKSLNSVNCSGISEVILHGRINLYDYFKSCEAKELSKEVECNPIVFRGESHKDYAPEIVFTDGEKSCAVKNSLFKNLSKSSTIENLTLHYDIEGYSEGALVPSIEESNVKDVHYKGNTHISNLAMNVAGLISTVKKSSVEDVSYKGSLTFDKSNDALDKVGGLFANVTNDSALKNVKFEGNIDIDSTSNKQTGGIVGYIKESTLSHAEFSGMLKMGKSADGDTNGCGGIVGYSENATLNQIFTTNVEINTASNRVGGLVGTLSGGTLDNQDGTHCRASTIKSLSGLENVGGAVGLAQGTTPDNPTQIKNVSIESDKIIGLRVIGGFGGFLTSSKISNINSKHNQITGNDFVGGFVGQFKDNNTVNKITSEVDSVIMDNTQTDSTDLYHAGSFIAYQLNKDNNNSSFSDIYSHVKQLKNDRPQGDKVSTGGFIGYFSMDYTSATLTFERIISKTDHIESSNNTGGFIGRLRISNSRINDKYQFSDVFSWANIDSETDRATLGGFIGFIDNINNSLGTYKNIFSATQMERNGEVLSNSYFSGKDPSKYSVTNYYFYDWAQNDENPSKPFQSKTDSNMMIYVENDDTCIPNLNSDSTSWSLSQVTVGTETKTVPIFSLTEACQ